MEVVSTSLMPVLKAILRSENNLKTICKLSGLEAQKVVDSLNQACN